MLPSGRMPGKKRALPALAAGLAALASAAAWFFLTLPDVSSLAGDNPPGTALMEQRRREAEAGGRKLVIRQRWARMSHIPPLLRQAVRVSEDAAFYEHEGVDFRELMEAVKRDWREKRLARGGSTITQQLAKNLYLSTGKSPLRKVREYFIARRMEEHLDKERIFYLYLNLIEWGPGVFGVEAAANAWFGKPASDLTLEEIVRLVAVIPRPLSVSPVGDSDWLRWRARWILGLLQAYGYIAPEERDRELAGFAEGPPAPAGGPEGSLDRGSPVSPGGATP